MVFGRLFRFHKEDGRKAAYSDPRNLAERDLADIGLMRPAFGRPFEHAPVEVPNDRI
jgi:hypothetical protein